jgi:hypothetical protein
MEAAYYPAIRRRYSFGPGDEQKYFSWLRETPTEFFSDWLGVDSGWLQLAAAKLLESADSIDPLVEWLDLIRRIGPAQWKNIKGAPRLALDLRVASEILLACDDELKVRTEYDPDADISHPTRRHLKSRLSKKQSLDEVLTEYELSPHPSLVVVLEGKTEMIIWKLIAEYYRVSSDEDFITVVDGRGVDRDLTSLMAFAAPRVTPWHSDGVLQLVRPATRFLIVSDAESKMSDQKKRDRRREDWVRLLFEAIPAEHRSQAVRQQLDLLVLTETWNPAGESFEFANFTPHQWRPRLSGCQDRLPSKPSPRSRRPSRGSATRRGTSRSSNRTTSEKGSLQNNFGRS